MARNWMLGDKCARCETRTYHRFEGQPTCEKCSLDIQAEREPPVGCPVCSAPMNKLAVRETVVDKCETCGGVWLDAADLEKLKLLKDENEDDGSLVEIVMLMLGIGK